MVTRSFLLSAVSLAIASPLMTPRVSAQEQSAPAVENSKFQFEGRVNASNVQVRSGPGENYYATAKLQSGDSVTVVGHKFEWLKIVPPQGSFSVVAKAWVQKSEDGKTGTITAESLSVRAGSSMTSLKVTVQCKVQKGEVVEILGEQDEYYQIKPPAEAYLYVSKPFVTPVRQLNPQLLLAEKPKPQTPEKMAESGPASEPEAVEVVGGNSISESGTPAPQPEKTVAAAPTTRPVAEVSAEAEFDRLDTEWNLASAKSLEDVPTAELLVGYEKLMKHPHLPNSMRRTVELRAASLRVKNRAKEEYLATMKQQRDAMRKIETLRNERELVEQRLENAVTIYTAVGLLQPSTLQLGKETLYRLTDPATGRSLCYVRSDDAKHVTMIGQFVGVKGELNSDPQLTLKVVAATEISGVDPERVNKGISAQITPPSLVSRSGDQASVGTN